MTKRLLSLAFAVGVLLAPACSSDDGGGSRGTDCEALFQELDEFRQAHQEKVISGEAETDEELQTYQAERDRLIQEYEDAGCGSITP